MKSYTKYTTKMQIIFTGYEKQIDLNKWTWDFGNGDSPTEQSPIYRFKNKEVRTVITLTVEGPEGSSKRIRYREVMIR